MGNGSPFTLSCWFKSDSASQRMLLAAPGSPRFYIEQIYASGNHRAHWGVGNSQNSSTSGALLNTTDIFNYVATYDGTNARGYLDGVLTDTTNIGSQTYNASTFRIGKYTDGAPLLFNGNIYFASVYKKALSDSEVLQNYNALKDRFV